MNFGVPAVKAKNVITLEVDGIEGDPGIGEPGISITNTNDPIYIGGAPGKWGAID